MNRIKWLAASLGTLALAPGAALAQHHHGPHGTVDFAISCSPDAQQRFSAGLALMHHMMYDQAEPEFAAAAAVDPDCAMAHWGIAMTVIHPLWGERPTDDAQRKGLAAVEKARALAPPTEREQAYVQAVAAFFTGWEKAAYSDQLAAWGAALEYLHERHPDDVDAGAFYALARLALAPKEDKTFGHQREAGALLEELHARAPEHPGLFHYIIHAYDNPVLAGEGLEVARAYDKLAPDVPHALHMPSHIFVRLGLWPDAINWNKRSAEAALRQPVGGMTSMHYAHALDYLAYGYLQRGEDDLAQEVAGKISAVANFQPTFASAYAQAAVPARYALERREWAEAAKLPVRGNASFPWDKFPGAEAITYLARGLGSARSGDGEGARAAVAALGKLRDQMVQAGDRYWPVHADAQQKTVEAWLALSEGKSQEALALMEEAADLEDSVDKAPVTPGAVLPARELLGDMLVVLGRPEEAVLAYETALKISPNRFNSLYAVAHAAELIEDREAVAKFRAALDKIATPEARARRAPAPAKQVLTKQ